MPSDGPPSIISAAVILFIVIFVIALIVGVSTGIWKAVILRRGGLNPVVAEEQLAARLNQRLQAGLHVAAAGPEKSAAPDTSGEPEKSGPEKSQAPQRSKAERLSEVMDLHERGLISDAELAEARAKIISD